MTSGLPNRDATGDQVTIDSGQRRQEVRRGRQVRHHHPQRPARRGIPPSTNVEEPQRHHPRHAGRHGVPRAHPGQGRITPTVRTWKKPITIARHAYGDVYQATPKSAFPAPARPSWSSPARTVEETRQADLRLQGRRRGAWACTTLDALHRQLRPLLLSVCAGREAGSVVLHQGHHFQDLRSPLQGHLCKRSSTRSTRSAFEAAGITYFYTLIDDAVARVIRSARAASSGRARTTTAT